MKADVVCLNISVNGHFLMLVINGIENNVVIVLGCINAIRVSGGLILADTFCYELHTMEVI